MSFTFNEWDVRDIVAHPVNPYDYGHYLGTDIYYQFKEWAKTQSIPAPGVGDGVYNIDDVETPAVIIDGKFTIVLRLKPQSPLISGDIEMQVDIKWENEVDKLRNALQ